MRKWRLILLTSFILFHLFTNGQRKPQRVVSYIDSIQILEKPSELMGGLRIYKIHESSYRYGIKEYIYTLKKKRHLKGYKLLIITGRDYYNQKQIERILYKEVYKNEKEHLSIYKSILTENVARILERYRKFGLKDLNIEKEVNYNTRENLVGYGCGFTGQMPYLGQKMSELLVQNNVNELLVWLLSVNPAKQVYGYIGIKVLIKNGFKLTQTQQAILFDFEENYNKKLEKYIYVKTCSGCSVGDIVNFREILKSKFLITIVNQYSSYYRNINRK